MYPGFTDAPGYITEASVRARYKSQVRQVARNKQAKHDLTWDEMVENGYVVDRRSRHGARAARGSGA